MGTVRNGSPKEKGLRTCSPPEKELSGVCVMKSPAFAHSIEASSSWVGGSGVSHWFMALCEEAEYPLRPLFRTGHLERQKLGVPEACLYYSIQKIICDS